MGEYTMLSALHARELAVKALKEDSEVIGVLDIIKDVSSRGEIMAQFDPLAKNVKWYLVKVLGYVVETRQQGDRTVCKVFWGNP